MRPDGFEYVGLLRFKPLVQNQPQPKHCSSSPHTPCSEFYDLFLAGASRFRTAQTAH